MSPFESFFIDKTYLHRIAKEFWGQGLALEAAQKCLEIGFNEFNLSEIVSFTAITNKKSERVMQKLKMTHDDKDNFYYDLLFSVIFDMFYVDLTERYHDKKEKC